MSLEGGDAWRPAGVPDLWTYQLHYFQYLGELEPGTAVELVEDWLRRNPPGAPAAWDPYPISLRVREWLEWLAVHPDVTPSVEDRMVASLVHQGAALETGLEYHLMANHLLENAISLCWLGLRLDGPLASRWRQRGLRLLQNEIAEQVLEDGTHYERSPMYQASISESLLRLAEVALGSRAAEAHAIGSTAQSAGRAMVQGLVQLSHPDGDIALVNDSALRQAPNLRQLCDRFEGLEAAGQSPATGLWQLPAAGYVGWRGPAGTYLLFDTGELGPDYNPGHGHADTLSFELSHRGRRIFTDTGVLTYAEGRDRAYDRSTAAHNTIELDGADQSELWGAFRCGRRARITEARAEEAEAGSAVLQAAYQASLGLMGRISHRRGLTIQKSSLMFSDQLEARGRHEAVFRLHVAPDLRAREQGGSVVVMAHGQRTLARLQVARHEPVLKKSPYHPEFGLELERDMIEVRLPFEHQLQLDWAIELL